MWSTARSKCAGDMLGEVISGVVVEMLEMVGEVG